VADACSATASDATGIRATVRCRRVLIEGVTILNSPMWELNPVLCTNVTVRVTIRSHGPNNDGCDPSRVPTS
jgi:polygalacturonase